MIVREISIKEFNTFISKHPLNNFNQSEEWKKVKDKSNKTLVIGCFDEEKLIAASLLVVFPYLKLFRFAYAPRGIITDYSSDKLDDIFDKIKEYLNKEKIAFLRIDPAITLNHIMNNGEVVLDDEGKSIFDKLISLGFNHYGFNIGFEAFQARFNHVVYLDSTYEETAKQFVKSTRKNIETSKNKGVYVKVGTLEDLEDAYSLFEVTANKKNFHSYSLGFYKNFMESFEDKCTLYMTYIDPIKYKENYVIKLKEEESNLDSIRNKMKTCNVGPKLINQEKLSLQLIEKYQKEIEYAASLGTEHILIASLLSIVSGSEYISFISGMKHEYKSFYPKYAMYDRHINDAIDMKLERVNFYGIMGVFDKSDPNYGIYEIKKTFGGESLEFIGQFDLPINKLYYSLYKGMVK